MTWIMGAPARPPYSRGMKTNTSGGCMRRAYLAIPALALAAAIGSAGCARKAEQAAFTSMTPAFPEVPIAKRPAPSAATIERGRTVYRANCVQCHGENGAGDGFGAPFLVPPPRDFTTADFKFRTTSTGELPTDEDLFRTISRGASGTGMPPWGYLLSTDDRWALVDYVKTFSPRFTQATSRAMATIPAAPKPGDAARGKLVYQQM